MPATDITASQRVAAWEGSHGRVQRAGDSRNVDQPLSGHVKMDGRVLLGAPCAPLRRQEMVGTVRFELTTPTTPLWCATRLRYAPTGRIGKLAGCGV